MEKSTDQLHTTVATVVFKTNLYSFEWRIPACLVGFIEIIYSSVYIYFVVAWLCDEYNLELEKEEIHTTTPPPYYVPILKPEPRDRTWLIMGIMAAAVYIPFNLLAIYYSIGLIGVTIKNLKGGIDTNYDAMDEAEDNLHTIRHWRYYNLLALLFALIILSIGLIFSLNWTKALIHFAVLYIMLFIVKRHADEIREFIVLQERREKLKIRRKSKALIDMLNVVDET